MLTAVSEVVRHVLRQAGLRAGDGSPADAHLPSGRSAIRRQPLRQVLPLPQPVSVHGVRTTDLPGELARHRGLHAGPAAQALSLGHSEHGVAQHAGQREQAARLANLRRGRAGVDSHCTADVLRRGPGTRSRQHGVCPGRFDHRSVSVRVSVGPVPVHESRGQAPHTARPARPDSDVPACVRRQNGRCSRARPLHPRAWGLLCDGSCLSRLRAPARAGAFPISRSSV